MKEHHTRLVMMRVRVAVEFNAAEGLYYAAVPTRMAETHPRPNVTTVRSADKETAIAEALIAAGYGSGQDK